MKKQREVKIYADPAYVLWVLIQNLHWWQAAKFLYGHYFLGEEIAFYIEETTFIAEEDDHA